MTLHDALESEEQQTTSSTSRNTTPSSTASAADDNRNMEERTRSADYRRQVIVREGTMLRLSSEKSTVSAEKTPVIGIRAMSAQTRPSLMLKLQMEEEAARLSEAKSRIVKGNLNTESKSSLQIIFKLCRYIIEIVQVEHRFLQWDTLVIHFFSGIH